MPRAEVEIVSSTRSLRTVLETMVLNAGEVLVDDDTLSYYRRQLVTTLHGAKQTENGLPTDLAIHDREWFAAETDARSNAWEGSFACACHWLDKDAGVERPKFLVHIDAAWEAAALANLHDYVYVRRAAVRTCAGVVTRLGKQYVLGLVQEDDWEQITLLDVPPARRKRSRKAAPGKGGPQKAGSSLEVGACG